MMGDDYNEVYCTRKWVKCQFTVKLNYISLRVCQRQIDEDKLHTVRVDRLERHNFQFLHHNEIHFSDFTE